MAATLITTGEELEKARAELQKLESRYQELENYKITLNQRLRGHTNDLEFYNQQLKEILPSEEFLRTEIRHSITKLEEAFRINSDVKVQTLQEMDELKDKIKQLKFDVETGKEFVINADVNKLQVLVNDCINKLSQIVIDTKKDKDGAQSILLHAQQYDLKKFQDSFADEKKAPLEKIAQFEKCLRDVKSSGNLSVAIKSAKLGSGSSLWKKTTPPGQDFLARIEPVLEEIKQASSEQKKAEPPQLIR